MKKKLLDIIWLLILTLAVIELSVSIFYTIRNNQDYSAKVEHRGHTYILLHADGSSAAIHDPDCQCKMSVEVTAQ